MDMLCSGLLIGLIVSCWVPLAVLIASSWVAGAARDEAPLRWKGKEGSEPGSGHSLIELASVQLAQADVCQAVAPLQLP